MEVRSKKFHPRADNSNELVAALFDLYLGNYIPEGLPSGSTGLFGVAGSSGGGGGGAPLGRSGGGGVGSVQNMNTMNALSRGFGGGAAGGSSGGTAASAGGGSFFDKFKSIPRQGMSGGRASAGPDNQLIEMMLEIQRIAEERRIKEEEERRRQFRPQF
jgi:hypothetical protein